MVQGLPPDVAVDRTAIFQAKFNELWAKHEAYSCGEELFNLDSPNYPELSRIKKELGISKLYLSFDSV